MQLSVVIPMFDEAESAADLVREVAAALEGRLAYEIVVVDDGSGDGTAARLERVRRELPALRVLRHCRNAGQSAAILTGVRNARGRWIATLDGDGQNDPADIPALWQRVIRRPCPEGPLLVAGTRVRRHDDALRRLASRVANAVRSALLRDGCPDTGCGLKLFPRDAFLRLPHFDHLHRFLPALFQRAGVPMVNVPVSHRPRRCGRSKYGLSNRLWVGVVDLLGVLWLQRRPIDVPLRQDAAVQSAPRRPAPSPTAPGSREVHP